MGKQLVIAEKPSAGKAIAKVLGVTDSKDGYMESDRYVVSWAFGHLIRLGEPMEQNDAWDKNWSMEQLPMLPKQFKYFINTDQGAKKQFNTLKNLINRSDIDGIINAGDAGREGELIQRLIYAKARNTKPVRRLWISSMADKDIKQGFENLKPQSEKDDLFAAALCRQHSDWKVGMNFSRLVAIKNNVYGFSIGSVQTPTVAFVRDRNDEIANFVSEPYFQVKANFDKEYWGILLNEDGKIASFKNGNDADCVINELDGENGNIIKYSVTRKTTNRPKLYNLSQLQIDANRKYKYSPAEVLQAAQNLYEKHKITTYPRTDSQYLNEAMRELLPGYVNAIAQNGYPVMQTPLVNGLFLDSNVINDKRVSDHHAIVINENYKDYDKSKLTLMETNVLDLIVKRMLLAFSPKYEYDQTIVLTKVNDYIFRTSGETPVDLGWKKTAKEIGITQKESPDSQVFYGIQKGDIVQLKNCERLDKKTKPPKQLTLGDLIQLMCNAGKTIEDQDLKKALNEAEGIGTEATRANIIEEILKRGYIEKKEKDFLFVTDKGRDLLDMAPEKLTTPTMRAEWEKDFSKIEQGQMKAHDFNLKVDEYIRNVIESYQGGLTCRTKSSYKKNEELGKCPKCGALYLNGKYGPYCSGKCGFILRKYKGNPLSVKQVQALINGHSVTVKGEKVNPSQNIIERKHEGKIYYFMDFGYNSGAVEKRILGKCPKCQGDYVYDAYGPHCDNKCGFVLKSYRKVPLKPQEIKNILDHKPQVIRNISKKFGTGTYNVEVTATGNLIEKANEGKTYYFMELDAKLVN